VIIYLFCFISTSRGTPRKCSRYPGLPQLGITWLDKFQVFVLYNLYNLAPIILERCQIAKYSCHTEPLKGHPITGHQRPRLGVEVWLCSFSTSALGGDGWSAPRPGHFTPRKDPVPIVQEAGWAPEPICTCAKILFYTRIRSPDHPAHSQSL
jgi:hypothetical protein